MTDTVTRHVARGTRHECDLVSVSTPLTILTSDWVLRFRDTGASACREVVKGESGLMKFWWGTLSLRFSGQLPSPLGNLLLLGKHRQFHVLLECCGVLCLNFPESKQIQLFVKRGLCLCPACNQETGDGDEAFLHGVGGLGAVTPDNPDMDTEAGRRLPWRVEAVEGTGRSLCFRSFGDLSFALTDSTFTPPPKRFTKPSQNCFMFFSLGLSSLVSSFCSRISDWFELVLRNTVYLREH